MIDHELIIIRWIKLTRQSGFGDCGDDSGENEFEGVNLKII